MAKKYDPRREDRGKKIENSKKYKVTSTAYRAPVGKKEILERGGKNSN